MFLGKREDAVLQLLKALWSGTAGWMSGKVSGKKKLQNELPSTYKTDQEQKEEQQICSTVLNWTTEISLGSQTNKIFRDYDGDGSPLCSQA